MARLTITLTDERHRALKEAAARRGKTIGQLIEESLAFYGIKTAERSQELVAKARRNAAGSGLSDREIMELAVRETNAYRRGRRR